MAMDAKPSPLFVYENPRRFSMGCKRLSVADTAIRPIIGNPSSIARYGNHRRFHFGVYVF